MKIKTNEEWAKKIINEGRFHLRKLLEDYPTAKPRIGVGFGKKEWRFITNNFELVKNAGLQGNVSCVFYIYFAESKIIVSTKKVGFLPTFWFIHNKLFFFYI